MERRDSLIILPVVSMLVLTLCMSLLTIYSVAWWFIVFLICLWLYLALDSVLLIFEGDAVMLEIVSKVGKEKYDDIVKDVRRTLGK